MKYVMVLTLVAVSVLSGCASVPMESVEKSNLAKEFNSPTPDTAGIYIYRDNTPVGAALKKTIWVNDECVGETAKGVFFYHEVEGDNEHKVSTESEFSPNDLFIKTESGELYFIEQYIKMGAFVGGAGLKQKDEETGKKEMSKLKMAKKGNCN
jgi:hypothetical protein